MTRGFKILMDYLDGKAFIWRSAIALAMAIAVIAGSIFAAKGFATIPFRATVDGRFSSIAKDDRTVVAIVPAADIEKLMHRGRVVCELISIDGRSEIVGAAIALVTPSSSSVELHLADAVPVERTLMLERVKIVLVDEPIWKLIVREIFVNYL